MKSKASISHCRGPYNYPKGPNMYPKGP